MLKAKVNPESQYRNKINGAGNKVHIERLKT
jgi:hypothetical protein